MEYKRLTERRGNLVIDKCGNCENVSNPQGCTEHCCYEVMKNRLAELEDKIEQGTLIELPCKIGDIVWVVCGGISQYKVTEFWYDGVFFNFRAENNEYVEEHKRFRFFDERIGKTVFLTREEAEKRLKELQGE